MINKTYVPLAVHNLHGGPEKNTQRRRRTIRKFLNAAQCGIGGFNELNPSDRRYLRRQAKKRGMHVFVSGQDGVAWTPTVIKVTKKRVKKVMTGGNVGADGVQTSILGDDDRRVGPNRKAIYLECVVLALQLEFEFVVTHLMARSFTVHRWRIPLFRRSVRSLAGGVRSTDGVLVGDMNSKEYIDLPDILDVPEPTPPTFGDKHYDQIIRWGTHIDVVDVETEATPSDHHMLKAKLRFRRRR